MSKPAFFPTVLRARGVTATSRPDGRWTVKHRGQTRTATHDELQALLNAKPHGKRKQPRQ